MDHLGRTEHFRVALTFAMDERLDLGRKKSQIRLQKAEPTAFFIFTRYRTHDQPVAGFACQRTLGLFV